jgi:hypothetical protein
MLEAQMRIRKEQMDVLSDYMVAQFERDCAAYLRAARADRLKDTDDRALSRLIRTGIDRAETYEIEIEDDVRLFIECMVCRGADFGEEPRSAAYLKDPKLDLDGKVQYLRSQLEAT